MGGRSVVLNSSKQMIQWNGITEEVASATRKRLLSGTTVLEVISVFGRTARFSQANSDVTSFASVLATSQQKRQLVFKLLYQ